MTGKIVIVAFTEKEGNSIAYKKFELTQVDEAVNFYKKQLSKINVSVISTRKTK